MKALILAAGRGKRMGKYTNLTPKGLIKLRNKALIDYQLNVILDSGIEDIGICTGYLNNQFDSYNFKTFHNSKWDETNMVYSLIKADSWLKNFECIVSYSDIFYKSEILKRIISHKTTNITIAYDKNWLNLWRKRFINPLDDAETFKLNKNGNLIEIGEKSNSLKDIEGQYMGLFKLNPSSWKEIKNYLNKQSIEKIKALDITSLLKELLNLGKTVDVVPNYEPWGEVDNKNDLEIYEDNAKEFHLI